MLSSYLSNLSHFVKELVCQPISANCWYTSTELAERLGVSRAAISERISSGHLPAQKIGRSWLISRFEGDKLIKAGVKIRARSAAAKKGAPRHWFRFLFKGRVAVSARKK